MRDRDRGVYVGAFAGFCLLGLSLIPAVQDRLLGQTLPAPTMPTLEWYYEDAGRGDVFLVCVDKQPTSACARVLRTSSTTPGPVVDGAPSKLYTFTLPTLPFGEHTAAVQTCTLTAAECSSGVSLTFSVTAEMKNVRGLRIVGGR